MRPTFVARSFITLAVVSAMVVALLIAVPSPIGKKPQLAASTSTSTGYRLVARDGGIFAYGGSPFYGSTGAMTLNQPIVGMASDNATSGYWLVASDGGVFAYNAPFFGSTGSIHLNKPIVGMAATPDGLGYWLVASDGGVFAYGNAKFYGSTGGTDLKAPIVGIAATLDGNGYALVASDGGVFTYGDAPFYGSAGGRKLNKPIVGMAFNPLSGGYWLVSSDGGVFTFETPFFGSAGSLPLNKPIVSMSATPDGNGYWLVASDGGIFAYGDAAFYGSAGSINLAQPIIGMSATSSMTANVGATSATTSTTTPRPTTTSTTRTTMPTTTTSTTSTTLPANTGCANPALSSSDDHASYTSGDYTVDNNVWAPASSNSQTLSVCSYDNWQVTATQPNSWNVKAYSNVHKNFSNVPIGTLNTLDSTFASSAPDAGNYNFAYDIWLNGVATSQSTELMVWTKDVKQLPGGSYRQSVVIDGVSYDVWTRPGNQYIAFVLPDTRTAGSLHLLSFLNYAVSQGWLTSSSALSQVAYGAEICETNNQPQTFKVSNFSVSSS